MSVHQSVLALLFSDQHQTIAFTRPVSHRGILVIQSDSYPAISPLHSQSRVPSIHSLGKEINALGWEDVKKQ